MRIVERCENHVWQVYSPQLGKAVRVNLPDDMPEEELVKRYMAHSNTAKGGARGLRKVFRGSLSESE